MPSKYKLPCNRQASKAHATCSNVRKQKASKRLLGSSIRPVNHLLCDSKALAYWEAVRNMSRVPFAAIYLFPQQIFAIHVVWPLDFLIAQLADLSRMACHREWREFSVSISRCIRP